MAFRAVSEMRNVTRTKMFTLVPPSGEQYLILNFPRCVPELLLSHLPKSIEFYLCIQMCYHQKCKLASLFLAHPVYRSKYELVVNTFVIYCMSHRVYKIVCCRYRVLQCTMFRVVLTE